MLKRHDRVCKIFIDSVPNSLLEELATTNGPFPALAELGLMSFEKDPPTLPDSFLSGSAPRLRSLKLWGVPFPGIGKLLLSTHDLVNLSLKLIPRSGHFSPDAMVDILSSLTKLKSLQLNFDHSETRRFSAHGASQCPPALTRVVLPDLTSLDFYGNSEYLENMVSRIDAPLDRFFVTFSNELAVSDIPLLCDFIRRTRIHISPHQAHASLSNIDARITLYQQEEDADFKALSLKIPCSPDAVESHLSSLAQACSTFLPPLPNLECLAIYNSRLFLFQWEHEADNARWMELLRPFITVKDLILDELVASSVASALQELVGERVTEMLPALQNIFLEGSPPSGLIPEGIAKFVAAREVSDRPVLVHHRKRKQ